MFIKFKGFNNFIFISALFVICFWGSAGHAMNEEEERSTIIDKIRAKHTEAQNGMIPPKFHNRLIFNKHIIGGYFYVREDIGKGHTRYRPEFRPVSSEDCCECQQQIEEILIPPIKSREQLKENHQQALKNREKRCLILDTIVVEKHTVAHRVRVGRDEEGHSQHSWEDLSYKKCPFCLRQLMWLEDI